MNADNCPICWVRCIEVCVVHLQHTTAANISRDLQVVRKVISKLHKFQLWKLCSVVSIVREFSIVYLYDICVPQSYLFCVIFEDLCKAEGFTFSWSRETQKEAPRPDTHISWSRDNVSFLPFLVNEGFNPYIHLDYCTGVYSPVAEIPQANPRLSLLTAAAAA